MADCTLVVFARAPVPGQVKTRLFRSDPVLTQSALGRLLSPETAAQLHQAFVADVLRKGQAVGFARRVLWRRRCRRASQPAASGPQSMATSFVSSRAPTLASAWGTRSRVSLGATTRMVRRPSERSWSALTHRRCRRATWRPRRQLWPITRTSCLGRPATAATTWSACAEPS